MALLALVPACRFGVGALAPGVGGGSEDLAGIVVLDAGHDLAHAPSTLTGSSAGQMLATDLTATGTLDWAHWGLTAAGDFDHRANGSGLATFAPIGASAMQFTTFSTTFTWSDGTPHASTMDTHTGVYMVGLHTGFSFDLPAPAGQGRVLQLFAGNYNSTGRFTASFADDSAPAYSADLVDGATAGLYRLFTVRFRAGAATTLHVTWQSVDGPGNIALQAAALSADN